MNAEELDDAKQKLRTFVSANGMQWVLDEVDEAVSLGISEVRTLRQSTQQGRITYEDVTELEASGVASSRRRKRAEEFARRRPMTDVEQVELLVLALRRVLVDLNGVADESIRVLNNAGEVEQHKFPELSGLEDGQIPAPPPVSEIDFAPDEGSTSPTITTESLRNVDRAMRAAEILTRIEDELRS
jgi:hypothetical protein